MPANETQFWGDDLEVTEALTPIAVLRQAAAQLPLLTKNLLQAEVDSAEVTRNNKECFEHIFSIVAPSLDRYASPLIRVRHDVMLVYPTLTFSMVSGPGLPSGAVEGNTEEELRDVIRTILQSGSVKAIIYSLIAKINEARPLNA